MQKRSTNAVDKTINNAASAAGHNARSCLLQSHTIITATGITRRTFIRQNNIQTRPYCTRQQTIYD